MSIVATVSLVLLAIVLVFKGVHRYVEYRRLLKENEAWLSSEDRRNEDLIGGWIAVKATIDGQQEEVNMRKAATIGYGYVAFWSLFFALYCVI